MFINHIKIALRTLSFYRTEGVVNILGLSAGIAISLILLIHVNFELSYDDGFPECQQIYTVQTSGNLAGKAFNSALTPYPLADFISSHSEVKNAVRIIKGANKLVSYDTLKFNEDCFFYADSDFFKVFKVPLKYGNIKHPLQKEDDVVLTEATALRYFGAENPIGKRLVLDNGIVLRVSAICESLAQNSHFNFDFIASTSAINQLYKRNVKVILNKNYDNWLALDWYTYVSLKDGVDIKTFQSNVFNEVEKQINSQIKKSQLKGFHSTTSDIHFKLKSIKDIHWEQNVDGALKEPGQKMYIRLFLFIAVFVIIATCVNFMHLTTANVSHRLNEIVIRKSFGITKNGLFLQFLIESVVYSFIALLLALVMVELLLPVVSSLLGFDISFNLLNTGRIIFYTLIITFGMGVLSGVYPAYVFSKIPVITIFQEQIRFKKSAVYARGLLFLLQMFTLTFLVLVAVGMIWQLYFLKHYDKGYAQDHILVVERGYAIGKNATVVKNQIKNVSGVEIVSSCMVLPGEKHPLNSFSYEVSSGRKASLMSINFVDENYLKLFNINLVDGGFIGMRSNSDLNSVVINQSAVRALSNRRTLGLDFYTMGENEEHQLPYTVVGVIKDYLYEGVKYPVAPLMLLPMPDNNYFDYLLIRVNESSDKQKVISGIEQIWSKNTNGEPFEYNWLSDMNAKELNNDVMVNKIIILFAIVAFLISMIGLRAYTSFMFEFVRNDISIKREFGAGSKSLIKDLFLLVNPYLSIAILMALPASFVFIQYWVSRFVLYNRIPVALLILMGGVIWLLSFVHILILLKQKLQKS